MEQNVNQDIIDGLTRLYHQRYDAYYEARNRKQEKKALNFLSRANRYKNVIQKISDHPSRITSGAEAQRLFKFGNKIKSEIDAIIKQRIVVEEEETPEFLEEIARLEEEHAWETNPEVWDEIARLEKKRKQMGGRTQLGGNVAIREPYEFEIVGRKNKRYLKGKGDYIGSGVQAQVFELCTTKGECSKFAIKVFTGGNDDTEFDYTREAEIMTHLRDHDVSSLIYDAWSCDGTHYIIMDQFTGPTLAEMVTKGKTIKTKYIRDLAETIRIMHEEANVIHNDLHLNNIVWDNNAKRFFIIDFSMGTMDYNEDEAEEDKNRIIDALETMNYYDEAEILREEWGM
jgi:serine/threonine protein kinase